MLELRLANLAHAKRYLVFLVELLNDSLKPMLLFLELGILFKYNILLKVVVENRVKLILKHLYLFEQLVLFLLSIILVEFHLILKVFDLFISFF